MIRFLDRLLPERLALSFGVFSLIAIAVLTLTVLVPATGVFDVPDLDQGQGSTRHGTISRVLQETTREGPRGTELHQVLEVESGGQSLTIERTETEADARRLDLKAGDRVLVTSSPGPNGDVYFIADYARDLPLWAFALAFSVLVVLIGRWQGLSSLVGMALSLLIILRFILPGIVSGHDPVLISIIGAVVIMASSLYLSHGINRKTTTALAGTAISLSLTAGLAALAISVARLSGLADEQAATLNIITEGGINPQGLLLAGMIIGALGVLDDVTVAQASAVYELKSANPLLTARDLFGRAMNIGRDHIASTVNTLFLAYAGAALPLLILLSLQTEPAGVLLNRELLATEVIRTMVGSIGIVASIPLTTALAGLSTNLARPDKDGNLMFP